jgi:hypothetical protein
MAVVNKNDGWLIILVLVILLVLITIGLES